MKRSIRITRTAAVTVFALGAAVAGAVAGAGTAEAKSGPWLDARQLPLNPAFHWQQDGKVTTTKGEFQWLYVCGQGSPTKELRSTSVSVLNYRTRVAHVSGAEIIFHFRSTAAAKAALAKVERDYAGCQKRLNAEHMVDDNTGKRITARVTRTATVAGGASYLTTLRTGTRLASAPDLPSDAQEFFVQRGASLTLVSVDGMSRQIDNTKGAQHSLRALANQLG